MNRLSIILLMVCTLFFAGCGGEEVETFSRYPYVRIPGFATADYIKQLADADPEKVYNAVCNLGRSARSHGNALWTQEPDPDSEDWQEAHDVFTNVCSQLQSGNSMILAASLRYLQETRPRDLEEDVRTELFNSVCRVESTHPLVQFEQISLLEMLVDETTQVPEALLHRFLDSKSWVVSHKAYDLIAALTAESIQMEMLRRYRVTNDQVERTFLLCTFKGSFRPEVIDCLKQEMFSTEEGLIPNYSFDALLKKIELPSVYTWMLEHAADFNPKAREKIFNAAVDMDDAEVGDELMHAMLDEGFAMDDEFLFQVVALENEVAGESSEDLSVEDMEKAERLLAVLDEVISATPELAGRLAELRAKTVEERNRHEALTAALDPLKEDYLAKVKPVLTEHGIPGEVQEKYLKNVPHLNVEGMLNEASSEL